MRSPRWPHSRSCSRRRSPAAWCPQPWATAAPLACALSPPALAYATAIYPDVPAAVALTAAALLALRYRDRPRVSSAVLLGLALAPVPWLGVKYLPAAVVVLFAAWWWAARRGRGLHGLVAAEVLFASLLVYVTVNARFYEALTPDAVGPAGRASADALGAADLLDRLPRLASLWLDRGVGLLRWAPAFALAFYAAWLLWRSRRDRLARAVSDQRDVEATATLLVLLAATVALVATVAAPTIAGAWFGGRHLVAALPAAAALAAWGLRHAPRVGGALCAITVAAGAWLFVALRMGHGSWAHPPDEVPWGPLHALFPRFGTGSAWAAVLGWALAAAAAALVARELYRLRRAPGGGGGGAHRTLSGTGDPDGGLSRRSAVTARRADRSRLAAGRRRRPGRSASANPRSRAGRRAASPP